MRYKMVQVLGKPVNPLICSKLKRFGGDFVALVVVNRKRREVTDG